MKVWYEPCLVRTSMYGKNFVMRSLGVYVQWSAGQEPKHKVKRRERPARRKVEQDQLVYVLTNYTTSTWRLVFFHTGSVTIWAPAGFSPDNQNEKWAAQFLVSLYPPKRLTDKTGYSLNVWCLLLLRKTVSGNTARCEEKWFNLLTVMVLSASQTYRTAYVWKIMELIYIMRL